MAFKIYTNRLNQFIKFATSRATLVSLAVTAMQTSLALPPATAADRVFQILGACTPLANAQFTGNGKKGRSTLTSFAPEGEAGFILDGVQGLKISQLKEITVDFTPPQTANTGEFLLLVKVEGDPVTRIQRFSLGTNDRPKLPNILARRTGAGYEVDILPTNLTSEYSRLTLDDTIQKIAFVFSARTMGPKIQMFVDGVDYNGTPAPILLENLSCNLK